MDPYNNPGTMTGQASGRGVLGDSRRSPLPAAGDNGISMMLRQDFASSPEVRRFKSGNGGQQEGGGASAEHDEPLDTVRSQIDALIKRTSGWGAVEMDARAKFGSLLKHGLDDVFDKARPMWPPKVQLLFK